MTADIVAGLKTAYDPEIPADIYELGLIYKIDIDGGRNVAILMTLTAPGVDVVKLLLASLTVYWWWIVSADRVMWSEGGEIPVSAILSCADCSVS